MHAALQTTIAVALPIFRLVHDHPYGLSELRADGTYLRKYPTGDWMTSPQVFEEVHNPFTALQLLDFDSGERGLLYLHDGSQAMLRDGERVRNILSMYDPWDEDHFDPHLEARVRLVPHGRVTQAQRWRLAQEFARPALIARNERSGDASINTEMELPQQFGPVYCDAPNVAVSACYRESEAAGVRIEDYAGAGMGFPYVLRLVELNGVATTACVRLAGPVAAAYRTNLLGEIVEPLALARAAAPDASSIEWSELAIELRPYEIATIYLDMVLGRKVGRDLDAHRSVWATVHRAGER
jgi:alpha-mannosidase